MKHSLEQLDLAIKTGFDKSEEWRIIHLGYDILASSNSALIKVSNMQLGTLARAMQVQCEEDNGIWSLTFEHNMNCVIYQYGHY
jgi:hypothetical protein